MSDQSPAKFIEVVTVEGRKSLAIAVSQIARVERDYDTETTHVVLVSGEDYSVEESYRVLCARLEVPCYD